MRPYNSITENAKPCKLARSEEEEKHSSLKLQDEFEKLIEICTDGRYHQLPLEYHFFKDRDHADYLGLAIKARDPEAIAFSKAYVDIGCPSSLLQNALLDMIVQEDTNIIQALGNVYPNIYSYSNIFAFHEPLAYLSGTSLIRIAVDQNRNKAAISMFKSIPVAMIGYFWKTTDLMKRFILDAMKERQIRLKPEEDEQPVTHKVLVDIFHNCVLEGNLEALDFLFESTGIPLTTMFTGENEFSASAMFIAAHAGYSEMVQYLGKKCKELFYIRNNTGVLPIHTAAANGHLDVIKALSVARDTMTDSVTVLGSSLTPFGLAIRNKKMHVAYLIISSIEKSEDLEKELKELSYWAILDDNTSLLDIYFEYNSFPASGCVDGQYNLLEMALTGSKNPKTFQNTKSSIKCLLKLIEIWKEKKLSFTISNDQLRGSMLALVPPTDLDALHALLKDAHVDPNGQIFEISHQAADGNSFNVKRTTFLNRIIAKGATDLVSFAIKNGSDPRIIDDDGLDAFDTAIKYKNDFVVNLFRSIYSC